MGFLKRLLGSQKKDQQSGHSAKMSSAQAKPDFAIGDNHIDDKDIQSFNDLVKWYPLPAGFNYTLTPDGIPYIERQADRKQFAFLIEADLLTFDEPTVDSNGKTIYITTEVFKSKSS